VKTQIRELLLNPLRRYLLRALVQQKPVSVPVLPHVHTAPPNFYRRPSKVHPTKFLQSAWYHMRIAMDDTRRLDEAVSLLVTMYLVDSSTREQYEAMFACRLPDAPRTITLHVPHGVALDQLW
jgi:hypothetical protein